ncbi:carbohydrate binding domain-containing protein [Rossellomorea aquimaris]|uniref:carbohydrate binding domain-containing protein n=1 Tax=Rossellomorea aquimaris TaxID=189382 RepID=UPI0007D0478B|nr:carbohydrate binding domain-containing protein [Rossellomorea aquimaris]
MIKKVVTSLTAACLIFALAPGNMGKANSKEKQYHLKDSILKDTTIEGNLVITPDAGENITLDNVTVLGTTLIKGTAPETLQVTDSKLHILSVITPSFSTKITVSGKSDINETLLSANASLEENEITSEGFQDVTVFSSPSKKEKSTLDGEFETITMAGKSGLAQLELQGISEGLILNALSSILLPTDSLVQELVVSEGGQSSTIDGEGSIEKATLKTSIVVNGKETSDAASFVTPWSLIWHDEFNQTKIDRDKWTFDIGNGFLDENGQFISGWGNNEKQYYTDRPENAKTEDGKLFITAKEEEYEGYSYTSARLKTKGLFAKAYGKFEMKASLPVGKGYWPAFWMLPEDDVYGAWASSGEIDIMEVQGSNPHEVIGTIHYGETWPNNKYTGSHYAFEDGTTISDEHVYSLEWEPGEIRWYVDGKLTQTQNNWYSKGTSTAANYTYPAPFDQPFHLLLNLAVGGNFDGDPTAETMFPQSMEVEYVRAYDLTGRPYKTLELPTVEPEPLPEGAKQPLEDGNLIYNNGFDQDWENVEGIQGVENTDYWYFLTLPDFGGEADIAIDQLDGQSYAKVDIQNPGSQPYSVQLIQDASIGKGRYYRVTFDAKSSDNRPINVKVNGGAERGFATYSRSESFSLTDQLQTYEMVFQMTEETDLAARMEFNLGLSTMPVWIGNARIEEISPIVMNPDASKSPLPDGNLVYNGTFDQGYPDRLLYWNIVDPANAASIKVDADERVLWAQFADLSEDVQLVQKGLQLQSESEYELTLNAKAESARDIQIEFKSHDGHVTYASETLSLDTEWGEQSMSFMMPDVTDLESQLIIHLGGSTEEVKLDGIKLVKIGGPADSSLIKNGTFDGGLDPWTSYIHKDAAASVQHEDGQAKVVIGQEGNETWSVQFYQGNVVLEPNRQYTLSFDAQSTVERSMEVTIENSQYTRFLSEKVQLNGEKTHYEYTFTMPKSELTSLKFLLGATGSPIGEHEVMIDNVELK